MWWYRGVTEPRSSLCHRYRYPAEIIAGYSSHIRRFTNGLRSSGEPMPIPSVVVRHGLVTNGISTNLWYPSKVSITFFGDPIYDLHYVPRNTFSSADHLELRQAATNMWYEIARSKSAWQGSQRMPYVCTLFNVIVHCWVYLLLLWLLLAWESWTWQSTVHSCF